jgi:hypothetical protein
LPLQPQLLLLLLLLLVRQKMPALQLLLQELHLQPRQPQRKSLQSSPPQQVQQKQQLSWSPQQSKKHQQQWLQQLPRLVLHLPPRSKILLLLTTTMRLLLPHLVLRLSRR